MARGAFAPGTSAGRVSEGCRLNRQLAANPIDHGGVITTLVLPEQPYRRVPRTVVASKQPTPIGPVRQKDPGRTPQCAGEVDDAGIDRDHQIKARNKGRGFGEIGEVRGEIYDFSPFEQGG